MERIKLFDELYYRIKKIKKESPTLVCFDGIDASGKTSLANEMHDYMRDKKEDVIRISIDNFHNKKEIRYRRGRTSPRGYYEDTTNYELFWKNVLHPLMEGGNLKYRATGFDLKTNQYTNSEEKYANKDSIVLVDGIFLLRPELCRCWDMKIFLDITFDTSIHRSVGRQAEKEHLGEKDYIIKMYKERYIPGQQLYFVDARPREQADIVVDNNNIQDPIFIKL